MERGDEKLTRPVLSFDEMPINQSLSPVNLSSSLFLPSFLFCPSPLSISHFFVFFFFWLSNPDDYPSVSHTYFIVIPLSSSPTLSVQFSIYLLVGLSCCLSLSLCAQLHLSARIKALEQQHDKLPSDSLIQTHRCTHRHERISAHASSVFSDSNSDLTTSRSLRLFDDAQINTHTHNNTVTHNFQPTSSGTFRICFMNYS